MGHQRLGDIPKTQKWQNVAKWPETAKGLLVPFSIQMSFETSLPRPSPPPRAASSGLETGTQLDIDSSCVPVSARGNYCFGDTRDRALNEKRVVLSTIRFARRTPLIRAGVNTSGTFPSI